MSIFPFINVSVNNQARASKSELPLYKEFAWDFENDCLVVQDGEFVIVTGNEAVKVWIYKALKTTRYEHLIYSWNFGNELNDLIGQDYSRGALISEIGRYLKDCLTINPYILDVNNINVSLKNDKLNIEFEVITIYGEVEISV